MSDNFVLLLHEVEYHPDSYVKELRDRFELPSIITVTSGKELRRVTERPIFNGKYLVLFDGVRPFMENVGSINFTYMFPFVCLGSRSQFDDAKILCDSKEIPYRVYFNSFTKERAMSFIVEQAGVDVSDKVCKSIITHTGLSPVRIAIAVDILSQVGFKESNVRKYIDKSRYTSPRIMIRCLLGFDCANFERKRVLLYVYNSRHWFKYVKKGVVDELDNILTLYSSIADGVLRQDTLFEYSDKNRVSMSLATFALRLFDSVSIASIVYLREWLKNASLLEVASKLSGL